MSEEFGARATAFLMALVELQREHEIRFSSEVPCILELRHLHLNGIEGEFLNFILRDRIESDRLERGLPRIFTRVMDDGIKTKDGAA